MHNGGDVEWGAWEGPLAVAVSQGCPLYSDDAFMRRLAREFGIPAFGTHALLQVLLRRGDASTTQLHEFEKQCVERILGDVPDALGYFKQLFKEKDGVCAHLAGVLARPAMWRDQKGLIFEFKNLIHALVRTEPGSIPSYVFAAATGLAYALVPDARSNVIGVLAATAIVGAGLEPERTASILDAARAGCARIDPDEKLDPAFAAVNHLWVLTEDFEPESRRDFITRQFSECGDDVSRMVTRVILALPPIPASDN